MKRLNLLLALILIASALLLSAESPAPKPRPVPRPSTTVPNREKSELIAETTNQYRTAAPTSRSTHSTPTQTNGPNDQKSDSNENGILVTFFTAVMAAATVVLAYYSCRLVAVTGELNAATKLAAIANIRSAEAATAALQTYRPFLQPEIRFCKSPFGAYITLHNNGIGPADIVSLSIDAELFPSPIQDWTKGEFVPSIYYERQDFRTKGGMVIGPGKSSEPIYVAFTILPNEKSDFEEQRRWIGAFGRVRYRSGARKGIYVERFFWWYVALPTYGGSFFSGPRNLNTSEYEET